MATSGTMGQTSMDIAKLIEKTYRRCSIPTGAITPELIDIAKENLFLLFNNFSNRGINLWCLDRELLGLRLSKAGYALPIGTIDILNLAYRQTYAALPTASNVFVGVGGRIEYDFGVAVSLPLFRVTTAVGYAGVSYTLAGSTDGISYADIKTILLADYTAGERYWYGMDPAPEYRYWKLTITSAHAPDNLAVSWYSRYTDLVMSRLNRSDYEALPSKRFEGVPSLQFMLDRAMSPLLTLWPVPNTEDNCLAPVLHRQIQDVGNSLTATIEVPDRWVDSVLWELASMCAVEVPAVPADRIALCQQQAATSLSNAEAEERDNSPIRVAPDISGYTR